METSFNPYQILLGKIAYCCHGKMVVDTSCLNDLITVNQTYLRIKAHGEAVAFYQHELSRPELQPGGLLSQTRVEAERELEKNARILYEAFLELIQVFSRYGLQVPAEEFEYILKVKNQLAQLPL